MEVERKWYLIDGKDKVLGKVAVEVAKLLRGKNKALFTPHQEIGDFVVVINAAQVVLTGKKREQKTYYRHSGYPGSLKSESYEDLNARKPGYALELAIKRMLPQNKMGRKILQNVKIYAENPSPNPHRAQKLEIFEV